ncbi:MAG: hypothetical protein ABIY55_22420 [Kofleriaceae bacterium]
MSVAPPEPRRTPPPLTAAHGAEIVTLATTTDGDAVVSADRLGGIRLWTTLDGTREPVVIRGAAARSIKLTRDGDGFVIGVLDAAGGVQVIRASAMGELRARVTVASDQPASQIESTSEGLLLLRADQTIELIARDGTVRTRLTPEPGSHVDELVARGDHVLALVLEDKQLHGRWIVIDHGSDHGARWGEATPKLPFTPTHAVLSPDGALLAVSRPRNLHPTLIDVATGVARKTPLCVTKQWPHEDGERFDESDLLRGDNPPAPLGFLSNTVVACTVMTALMWWNVDGTPTDIMVGGFAVAAAPTTISPHGLIAGNGPSLALASPIANHFLGYGFHDVAQLRVGASGVMIGGDQQAYVLDAELRERARLEVGRGGSEWTDLALLDDRYVVTLANRRTMARTMVNQIAVVDAVTKTTIQLLPFTSEVPKLAYEPSTRLLATSVDTRGAVLRFDPVSHTFGPPIRLANGIVASQLALVDPRQAGGVAVLELDPTHDGVLVGEIREADLDPAKLALPRTSYRVPGELRAVDRAGRLYMHGPDDHDDVVIYSHGKAGARLVGPGVNGMTLRPNADGSQIAAFAGTRVALFSGDGKLRWDTAQWSNSDVAWSARGELLVAFTSAIATVDLASGALALRRCGWGFGLSDQPHEAGRGAASICDANR